MASGSLPVKEGGLGVPVFSNKQFGFLKGRSTVLQLLHIMDMWTECLESGGQINAIYSDFEKAFDKVPHRLFIAKNETL